MRRRGAVQLRGYRCHLRRQRNLEVVATATKVDDIGVVRVTKHAVEEPVAEAFAIATQQLERALAKRGRRNRSITLHHGRHGAANQVKGLIPRQALAGPADTV